MLDRIWPIPVGFIIALVHRLFNSLPFSLSQKDLVL